MVRIKQQPASTAELQALRRLIDQGRWAKTQGLPKAFDWCVPLPHKGIPEGGEHKVMAAHPWRSLIRRKQHVLVIEGHSVN